MGKTKKLVQVLTILLLALTTLLTFIEVDHEMIILLVRCIYVICLYSAISSRTFSDVALNAGLSFAADRLSIYSAQMEKSRKAKRELEMWKTDTNNQLFEKKLETMKIRAYNVVDYDLLRSELDLDPVKYSFISRKQHQILDSVHLLPILGVDLYLVGTNSGAEYLEFNISLKERDMKLLQRIMSAGVDASARSFKKFLRSRYEKILKIFPEAVIDGHYAKTSKNKINLLYHDETLESLLM